MISPRPLAVCCVLAVPTFAIAAVLHDRPAPDQVSTLDPPVYVVHDVTTAVPTTAAPPVVSAPPAPAVVTQTADRGIRLQVTPTVPPPETTGLNGLPLAPVELDGCDEAKFYRQQAGLIAHFDGVAWRESRCESGARNWCCTGHYQIHKLWVGQLEHCGVWVRDDLYDPQRNACAAAHIYKVQGGGAWSTW